MTANPDLRVADVTTLAGIAHTNEALLTVDSTLTPRPLARPLEHGADLVIPSLTRILESMGHTGGDQASE